jgi:pyruvate ferredoxin oxidoreductase alpha subunit
MCGDVPTAVCGCTHPGPDGRSSVAPCPAEGAGSAERHCGGIAETPLDPNAPALEGAMGAETATTGSRPATCHMLTGNAAAAWGARLAEVDYVPAFPITPQTEIIEDLAGWFAEGQMAGKFVMLDSEHSMITAAGAAAATGCRVFTATSSQGLLYGLEALWTVAGWRVPFVLVNVSRGLGAPLTLEPDHNDVLATRDIGCIQIHAETCQEVVDSVLMAYRIAEDPRVMLPVIVNMDGFYLSFTREPVVLPEAERVHEFLPAYQPTHAEFRASRPMAQGVSALNSTLYSHFRYQMHLASQNALQVHAEVAAPFSRAFGREYDVVERYQIADADYVLVMMGSFATKAKAAIRSLRALGKRVGLLRLRLIRPLPRKAIAHELAGRRGVAVIDQNLSPGLGGILFHEVAGVLGGGEPAGRVPLRGFVGGLGGKDIGMAEFRHVVDALERAEPGERFCGPELLFTEAEARQIETLTRQAGGLQP